MGDDIYQIYLLIIACNCAFLTLSLDGKSELSQSSGFSFLCSITSFLRQISSLTSNCSFFICSLMIKSGPMNHSNTLSLGLFILVNSKSSAGKVNYMIMFRTQNIMHKFQGKSLRRNIQMTNPDESDFADMSRHCKMDQAGSLMPNFLQLPVLMHSSTSLMLIRPSRRSILPFTSQDLNNQSQICIIARCNLKNEVLKQKKKKKTLFVFERCLACTGLYCWIAFLNVLDRSDTSFIFKELSLLILKSLLSSSPNFFFSWLVFMFLRYLGLAATRMPHNQEINLSEK